MSEKMIPIPFSEMLRSLLTEYKEYHTFYGVPVVMPKDAVPIGPAAGPHTQLAANIVAAYGAGATYFELKTVQILEGEELQIKKPCIYVGDLVFNTEWSTELTIEEARNEYIKAYLLLQILSREFHLLNMEKVHFVMSVGYDLAGIQSQKVDHFLETMKDASITKEWMKDCAYIKEHKELFSNIDEQDIEHIVKNARVSDTVTLSTMHGCKAEEIEDIVTYLLREKNLHVFVKMNPTLLGKERVEKLLWERGYEEVILEEGTFEHDLDIQKAKELILSCLDTARECNKTFGIKLTNTLPVSTSKRELKQDTMYLSGKALYPIAIAVAKELTSLISQPFPISYSGGADQWNIKELLETGIKPVTVSSLLLKAGGYKNMTKLCKATEGYLLKDTVDKEAVARLSNEAWKDLRYNQKKAKDFDRKEEYSPFCASCNNCVDVCPNRANILVETEGQKLVIHRERLCNECGCCTCECVKGHSPYEEKFTIYEDEKSFLESEQDGILYTDEKQCYRVSKILKEIPEQILALLEQAKRKGRL